MSAQLSFGRWLKRRRSGLGLTQRELARRVGYSAITVRKLEADELRPSRQMAEKLAEHLGIALEERASFIRFARDEPGADEVVLPTQSVHAEAPRARPQATTLPTPPTPLIGCELGVPQGVAECLAGYGALAIAQGEPQLALCLLAATEAALEAIGGKLEHTDRAEYERSVTSARALVDGTTFAASWEAGQVLTLEEAAALALQERPPARG